MAKIVVTRPISEAGLEMLRDRFEVVVHDNWLMNEDQLCEFVNGAEVIVSLLTDPITDRVLEAAGPELKLVAQYTVGFDNLDLGAIKRRGLTATNTSGFISSSAVAEHAFTLMMAAARNLLPADRFIRDSKYDYWRPELFTGQLLHSKTVGIVGTGQIGTIFAHICHAGLNMRIIYSDVVPNELLEQDMGAEKRELSQVLAEADVVSIHVPLLPATRGMIGYDQICLMKPSAILINTARGPIVKEADLVRALQERKIFGAGLDVFENEPYLADGLAGLENVIVTPHIASATEPTRDAMSECVARNILAFYDGKTPPNLIKLPDNV